MRIWESINQWHCCKVWSALENSRSHSSWVNFPRSVCLTLVLWHDDVIESDSAKRTVLTHVCWASEQTLIIFYFHLVVTPCSLGWSVFHFVLSLVSLCLCPGVHSLPRPPAPAYCVPFHSFVNSSPFCEKKNRIKNLNILLMNKC